MLSKILLGISITGLIGSLSLGWLLKIQYAENGKLEADVTRLESELTGYEATNKALNETIDALEADKRDLLTQVRQGEDEKRHIRAQLEVTSNDLRKALSDSPEFREYPLPDPVSAAVSSQLDRLWPETSDGGKDGNTGSKADNP